MSAMKELLGHPWVYAAGALALAAASACAEGSGADVTSSDDGGSGDDAAVEAGQGDGPGACPSGEVRCGYGCVHLDSDPNFCGSCGTRCPAGDSCVSGKCVSSSCPTGQTNCGGGAPPDCVDLSTDPQNCGMCGNACDPSSSCSQGQCSVQCEVDAGWTKCVSDAGASCVDLTMDPSNCGKCNNACNAPATCMASTCTCPMGQTMCGPDGGAGVCVDTTSDDANCGACGHMCGATQACASSMCLDPPAQSIVFVSSQAYAGGSLGGLAGADAKCQSLAQAAGLAGTFKAWLSDSTTDAAARITHWPTPYVLADSTQVASNWTQLVSGSLASAISKTEAAGTPPSGSIGGNLVWTNTTSSGTKYSSTDCGDWKQANGTVSNFHFGDPTQNGGAWTLNMQGTYTGNFCSGTAPIYCIQNN